MTTEATIAEARSRAQKAEDAALEQQSIYRFFRNHPELACDANAGILREFHAGEIMTEQSLEESLAYPGLKERLATKTPQQVQRTADAEQAAAEQAIQQRRNRAIQYIQQHRQFSSPEQARHSLEHLQSRFVTVEQLEQQVSEIQESLRLRQLSVPELKAIVRGKPAPEFPPLDALHRNREVLLSLSANELRVLIRRHGLQQVNDVLAGQGGN